MVLNSGQKDAKIAYLLQENARLREVLLDEQVLSGAIRLSGQDDPEDESAPWAEDEVKVTYGE